MKLDEIAQNKNEFLTDEQDIIAWAKKYNSWDDSNTYYAVNDKKECVVTEENGQKRLY